MAEGTDIFQQYADHLLKKAASVVAISAIVGAVGGAVLGAVPGLLNHSLISPGANYLAILLGGIAGGIAGCSFGEKRAIGIRFQAHMILAQRTPSPAPAPAPVVRTAVA